MVAAKCGDIEEIKRVVALREDAARLRNSHHNTPLRTAIAAGQLEAAQLLVKLGADIHQLNHGGSSLMEVAAFSGHRELVMWLKENGLTVGICEFSAIGEVQEITALVLADREVVDARDRRGQTPLHYAARCGQVPTIEVLLQHGAPVNAQDRHGHEALCQAVENRQPKACEALLAAGANPNAQAGYYGGTVLHRAAIHRDIASVRTLLEAGSDPNRRDSGGKTPLHDAIGTGNMTLASVFLGDARTDVMLRSGTTKFSPDGETPLEYARNRRKLSIVALLEQYVV